MQMAEEFFTLVLILDLLGDGIEAANESARLQEDLKRAVLPPPLGVPDEPLAPDLTVEGRTAIPRDESL